MFGWKKKKSVALIPFAEARPQTFNTLLCDGVSARNLGTFSELMSIHASLQSEHPECRVLASLDDLHQAAYTSGHATDAFELDPIEGEDAEILEAFEESEHSGFVNSPAVLSIRLDNLGAKGVEFTNARGALDWETPGDANDLVTVNRDAEISLRIAYEKEVLFQFVPVVCAADTVAAFPNGYFTADLNPMQTHAIARHLETEYDLALFGIGSRFLGFRRATGLDAAHAAALSTELVSLYAKTPADAANTLAQLLTGRDWLLLRYTES